LSDQGLSFVVQLTISAEKLDGSMLVDILITTPGRLADHILHTPGFTLQHLRYLVLDEADRLLQQSFQSWTELVIRELSSPKVLQKTPSITDYIRGTCDIPIIGKRYLNTIFNETSRSTNVRKFIFSATLTYDVGKLASLQMPYPEIISVRPESQIPQDTVEPTGDDAIFSIPSTLHEYAVAVKNNKPLHLLHLLNKHRIQDKTLIFTHSTETATRLTHLLSEVYKSTNANISTAVISSEVPFKMRKRLLSAFIDGVLNIIITTDLLSRGMDVKGIKHVVSYDSPPTARVYVHRAGRTARSGRVGDVWSLIEDKEARWFWKSVVPGIQRSSKVERIKFAKDEISSEMRDAYHSFIDSEEEKTEAARY